MHPEQMDTLVKDIQNLVNAANIMAEIINFENKRLKKEIDKKVDKFAEEIFKKLKTKLESK